MFCRVTGYTDIPVSCHKGGNLHFPSVRWDGGSLNWNNITLNPSYNSLNYYRTMVLNHEMGHYLDNENIIPDWTNKKNDRDGDDSHEFTCETDSGGKFTGSNKAPIMQRHKRDKDFQYTP